MALKHAEGSGQGRGRVLKPLLLTARPDRTPTHLKDIASQLSMFDLFRNMDPEFRTEIGSIVEYVSVPKGEKMLNGGGEAAYPAAVTQLVVILGL